MDPTPREPEGAGWTVIAALLTVQLLFGLHYVAAKVVLENIEPAAWAFLRVSGAAVLVLLVVVLTRRPLPTDRSLLLKLAGLSVFGVVLNQVLFIEGLARTVPSHSSLIMTAIPVLTLLLAIVLGQEEATGRKFLAVALSLSGVLFLLSDGGLDLASGTTLGDLLTLANAASFALFLVLSRPLLRRLDPAVATAVLFTAGSVLIGFYAAPSLADVDWRAIPARTWMLTAFIIIGPTVGGYFLNNWALRRVESSLVALFIYLQFLLAAPLSWLLLDEAPSWRLLPAAALVFSGVALSVLPLRRHASGGRVQPTDPSDGGSV